METLMSALCAAYYKITLGCERIWGWGWWTVDTSYATAVRMNNISALHRALKSVIYIVCVLCSLPVGDICQRWGIMSMVWECKFVKMNFYFL